MTREEFEAIIKELRTPLILAPKPTKADWAKWAGVDHPIVEENTIDYMAIINGLKSDIAELREENEALNDAIKWKNHDHHETHKNLMEARQEATEKQATIDNLRKEWSRTIDLALAYETKLVAINKEYPGILGGEELKALMTHPE